MTSLKPFVVHKLSIHDSFTSDMTRVIINYVLDSWSHRVHQRRELVHPCNGASLKSFNIQCFAKPEGKVGGSQFTPL